MALASLGHLAAGMASGNWYAARIFSLYSIALVVLSFLPDADVIGFRFGVAYGDPWGHRGASHSLVFALIAGTAVGLLVHYVIERFGLEGRLSFEKPFEGGAGARSRAFKRGVFCGLCVLVMASHGIFDMLTDGGMGVALFWPFDDTRHFFPWTPLPVAPIGRRFFTTPRGWYVAAVEIGAFLPLFAYAFLARRKRRLSDEK